MKGVNKEPFSLPLYHTPPFHEREKIMFNTAVNKIAIRFMIPTPFILDMMGCEFKGACELAPFTVTDLNFHPLRL